MSALPRMYTMKCFRGRLQRKLTRATSVTLLLFCLALLVVLWMWTGYLLVVKQSPGSEPRLEGVTQGGAKDVEEQRDEVCDMCDEPFAILPSFAHNSTKAIGNDSIPVFRHFSHHEPWPAMQPHQFLPGQVPSTVHYLWCDVGYFEFHHYLGVLSLIRLLQPLKIIFHYVHLPTLDDFLYNTWFLELKQSVPGLILKPALTLARSACVSGGILPTAFSLLRQNGGVFVTSNVILSHVPPYLQRQTVWSAFVGHPGALDTSHGVIIASEALTDKPTQHFIRQVLSSNTPSCVSPENYEGPSPEPTTHERIRCVFVSNGEPVVHPKDIMHAHTFFAELSRWFYYGTRAPLRPKRLANCIPRISHVIWISPNKNLQKTHDLQFDQYLSILSALHVGGFRRVYVHANVGFSGEWWEKLKMEKVTSVFVEDPEMVFQQSVVRIPQKKTNILRNAILYKYGGAYHDLDAVWTQRVPDWLLAYPAVGGLDWVGYGVWPDTLNNGVLLAKPHAPWFRHLQAYYRYYTEAGTWKEALYGAIMTTYRTYERHPDQLFLYDRLQVMCHAGICHPTWEKGFRRLFEDRRDTLPFDWRTDTLVVHVTTQEVPSFASPDALKRGTDMMAEIGRFILEKSGHEDLLN